MDQITDLTRRNIVNLLIYEFNFIIVPNENRDVFDTRKYYYHGVLSEIEFLKRLYSLKTLPSYDGRYSNAEDDIRQHTEWNDDYDIDWVFNDDRFQLSEGNDDKYLLDFICEIFHPVVRNEKLPWQSILEHINEILIRDGYIIYPNGKLSGHDIYKWKNQKDSNKIVREQMEIIKEQFNTDYVSNQVDIMYEMIETNPSMAIGKAKELLEMCSKTILDEQNIIYKKDMSLQKLMTEARKSLDLLPKKVHENDISQKSANGILSGLGNITQYMGELRNIYGDGHGKNKNFISLPARYAHLAVGASVTAVNFLWETYQLKKD